MNYPGKLSLIARIDCTNCMVCNEDSVNVWGLSLSDASSKRKMQLIYVSERFRGKRERERERKEKILDKYLSEPSVERNADSLSKIGPNQ